MCEGGVLIGRPMDKDTGAWWCEMSSVEVEVAEGSCICGNIGLAKIGAYNI